jgi:hypothetical protein
MPGAMDFLQYRNSGLLSIVDQVELEKTPPAERQMNVWLMEKKSVGDLRSCRCEYYGVFRYVGDRGVRSKH